MLSTFFANLAGLIAPVLTPYIASYAGWSWGLYFGCFIVLLGAVACWQVKLPSNQALTPASS